MNPILAALATTALVLAPRPAPAQVRAETAIRQTVLPGAVRRYIVMVTVGRATLQAGLDSGSVGLRLLPGAVAPADLAPSDRGDSYNFDSGVKLDGVIADAPLTLGALTGRASVQTVRTVGCTVAQPTCPAHGLPQNRYGLMGDGIPGAGFKAILGTAMGHAEIANPLIAVGARRWIVDLPRPGEAGRLVLNPTAEETAGFAFAPVMPRFADQRGGLHDAVRGCLVNTQTRRAVCGAVVMDTGEPGLRVVASGLGAIWRAGTPAVLVLADLAGHVVASERLTIGDFGHASRLTFVETPGVALPMIYTGLSPYLAFSVLYDPQRNALGFKPRPPAPDAPVGRLGN